MASNTDVNCMRSPDTLHVYRQLWARKQYQPYVEPLDRYYCIYCREEALRLSS